MSTMTMTAVAASSPRHRLRVVCTRCGSPRETHGLHYCPVLRCDPANDDRRAPRQPQPQPHEIRGVE